VKKAQVAARGGLVLGGRELSVLIGVVDPVEVGCRKTESAKIGRGADRLEVPSVVLLAGALTGPVSRVDPQYVGRAGRSALVDPLALEKAGRGLEAELLFGRDSSLGDSPLGEGIEHPGRGRGPLGVACLAQDSSAGVVVGEDGPDVARAEVAAGGRGPVVAVPVKAGEIGIGKPVAIVMVERAAGDDPLVSLQGRGIALVPQVLAALPAGS